MDLQDKFLTVVSNLASDDAERKKYAEHLAELFEVIDPAVFGCDFEDAVRRENYEEAISLLAAYYREKPYFTLPEISAEMPYDYDAAKRAADGYAREVNIDWKFPNGEIDFNFDPTLINGPRNHEWLWQFNRHNYWQNMARAYVGEKDEKLAEAFRRQLLTWIKDTYVPTDIENQEKGDENTWTAAKKNEPWNAPGSTWRTIECGIRLLRTWPMAYDGFKRSKTVEDIVLVLMIASMHRQSLHLVAHPTQCNWLIMEMNGVYTFTSFFPEFKDSEEHRKIASEVLVREISKQILPDGMHNELSPDYQSVTFTCAANFYSIAKAVGFDNEIPTEFADLIKNNADAAIKLATPAFTQPRTNDTFTIPTNLFTSRVTALFGKTPECDYVNSERAEGLPPKETSVLLPYAGFAVMRSGWDEDATYLCFDVGPLGAAHVHQDKLNINIYKGSEELIFDDGGGQYDISRAREYAISGYDHNIVLVDGLEQNRGHIQPPSDKVDVEWLTNDEFDYARAVYSDGFGKDQAKLATHAREVKFFKPNLFCVTDTLTSADGNAHDYEILFHMDTTSATPIPDFKNAYISNYGRKHEIAVIPLDEREDDVTVDTASGVTEPSYRGWYNGRNERNLHKALTLSRSVKGVKDHRFTTLLIPVEAGSALPKIERKPNGTVSVTVADKTYDIDPCKLN